MLGGAEFISACAWLSPRFVIKPGALAEQGNLFFFFMKSAEKLPNMAISSVVLGSVKENFGSESNPAWVLLPNGLNSPIKQKGLSCPGFPLNLNSFSTPDHLKWDLM